MYAQMNGLHLVIEESVAEAVLHVLVIQFIAMEEIHLQMSFQY